MRKPTLSPFLRGKALQVYAEMLGEEECEALARHLLNLTVLTAGSPTKVAKWVNEMMASLTKYLEEESDKGLASESAEANGEGHRQ